MSKTAGGSRLTLMNYLTGAMGATEQQIVSVGETLNSETPGAVVMLSNGPIAGKVGLACPEITNVQPTPNDCIQNVSGQYIS